ncbi:MAG: redoxin domain-containing protein [Bacteroidales bacterium]|nr:redoxin domain-containing protein [Bacteroidales bacterium]
MVEGSPESKRIHKLYNQLDKALQRITDLSVEFETIQSDPDFLQKKSRLDSMYFAVKKAHKSFSTRFILDDPCSFASLQALYQQMGKRDPLFEINEDFFLYEKVDSCLSSLYPSSGAVKTLNKKVVETREFMKIDSGSFAPEINLPDTSGNNISLHSLHGKYVLVSFWASWCTPCRDLNASLIPVYKKYHDKGFEIYQVSLDKTEESWKTGVIEDKIPWINVSDLKYWNSSAVNSYYIRKVPFSILIDKDGKIVEKDIPVEQLIRKLVRNYPMKNILVKKIVFFAFAVLLLISCTNKKQVVIRGHITQSTGGKVYLEEQDLYFSRRIDSAKVHRNGKFTLKATVKNPDFYMLKFSNNKTINLLLEPNEKLSISANLDELPQSIQVEGSNGSKAVNEVNKKLMETQFKIDSISSLYEKTENADEKERLVSEYRDVLKNHHRYSLGFIFENINSLAAYTAINQQYRNGDYVFNTIKDLQYYKIVTDSLTRRYSRSKHVIALKENTKEMIDGYNSQRLMSMVKKENFHLPEISLPGMKENDVKLSSLKGKIVLLNFWATWSRESIEKNLALKDLYSKYRKRGFEIYSVSLDNSMDKWLYEIKFDDLSWIHVIDTLYPNSRALMSYNVSSIPFNYLIGRILKPLLQRI